MRTATRMQRKIATAMTRRHVPTMIVIMISMMMMTMMITTMMTIQRIVGLTPRLAVMRAWAWHSSRGTRGGVKS